MFKTISDNSGPPPSKKPRFEPRFDYNPFLAQSFYSGNVEVTPPPPEPTQRFSSRMPSPRVNPNLMMSGNDCDRIIDAIDVLDHDEIDHHVPDLTITWTKTNRDNDIAIIDGHE